MLFGVIIQIPIKPEQANRKHKLLLNDVVYIDEDRTFNAVATSSHGAFAPFNVTVRVYDDTSLAKKIHEITNLVNKVSVARSTYPHFPSSGSARLVFEPFCAKTFEEWANSLLSIEKQLRDKKINKAFRHFTGRGDARRLNNGCLRSYSYFILHNALFYDARDRYRCIYKMIMFRDMDQIDFNGRMFSKSNPHIAQWWTEIPKTSALCDCFKKPNDYETKYYKESSILKIFSNCYKHMQDSESGLIEIQSELDQVLPNVIFPLFYNFVEQIEAKKDFHGYQVLEYFVKINPSPDFLD